MAQICEVCGKKPTMGRTISHAHNVNPRLFRPNIRTLKIKEKGASRTIKICMKCLKAQAKI